MKKLISIFVLAILFFLRFEEFKACTHPPPDTPSVTLQRYSQTTACIIIYRYTSFGADSTNFCGCALNSVNPIISVDAVLITDTNNVPIPGFPFVFNPNTGPSFNSFQPGNWKGFFSDIQQLIPSNVPLKIQIMVTIPPNSSSVDQLQLLATNLASATYFFASDEVNSNGMVLNTHLQFRPAGTITILRGPVDLLDGNQVLISSHNSIQEAYNAIPGTLTQSYFIELLSAYVATNDVYPINLTLKSGHSAANKITIRPATGNNGEVISSSSANGIVNIHGADYVILDGRPGGTGSTADLEVRNTATTSNANTITLDSGATNCVIKYIRSFNATNNTTGPMNIEIGASPNIPGGCSNNLIENCFVSGGRTCVGSNASTGVSANPNVNNIISNCTIENFGFVGIWLLNLTSHTTIEDCVINGTGTASNIANVTAINIQSTFDGYVYNIRRNRITNFIATSTATTLAPRGIATITAPGTGSVLNIENNFIAMTANNNNAATTYGIFTTGTTENYTCNIYYNTVLIGGVQTGGLAGRTVSAGIVKQSTAPGIVYNQRNNICVNNRTGGTAGVVHSGGAINGTEGILDIDYNCYFSSTGNHASWDSINYSSLISYQAAAFPNEQNSVFKNVNFVSTTDLHLTGASIGDPDLLGIPIAGIINDIDRQLRSATIPYKGADEISAFLTLVLKVNLEACSPNPDTIIVLLRDTVIPYLIVDSVRGVIDSTGSVKLNFSNAANGTRYYIVVKHRSSIETWSKAGGEIFSGGVLNYDFTTAASQAFGNNQTLVNGKWSIYSGDVNQDGVVDGADGALIDNDSYNFVTGYVATDLNCDSVVDGSDAVFADNNAANFVTISRP